MMLERTLSQLDIGHVPDDVATRLGHLGYAQWLATLKGSVGYVNEAMRAHDMALPFAQTSPAVAVFCQLLMDSTTARLKPLDLKLPAPARRGGAKARRGMI